MSPGAGIAGTAASIKLLSITDRQWFADSSRSIESRSTGLLRPFEEDVPTASLIPDVVDHAAIVSSSLARLHGTHSSRHTAAASAVSESGSPISRPLARRQPQLLALLAGDDVRAALSQCCPKEAALKPSELLERLRAEVAAAEWVHNFCAADCQLDAAVQRSPA